MKPAKELANAAGQGDLDTMRALMDAHPEAARDWQPIMDACYWGQPEAVALLLQRGADPNVVSKTAHRYRPLHRAIERKITVPRTERHVRTVEILLKGGAEPSLRGMGVTAFAMAALAGDHRFLNVLPDPPPDVYHVAALADLPRVRALLAQEPGLSKGADENGWSALDYALRSRMGADDPSAAAALRDIVKALVEAGADPSTALDGVVYRNDVELTKLFLGLGATIQDGDTLNHAACEGAHDALALVVAAGTNLDNTKGTEHHGGYTPFGCTLTMRSLRGASWFLDQGVDPNRVGGDKGESSLHVAVRSGAGEPLLRLLLERGADPTARDASGLTPLEAAREKGNAKAVAVLGG